MSAMTTVDLGAGESGLVRGCGGGCGSGCGCGCGCGCSCSGRCGGGCATCGTGTERPRWFAGQLVGPGDLEALQQWVIGRSRRHNRMLHGWGVSCGLAVTTTPSPADGEPTPWSVTVGPGYALTACGDEVCVPAELRIDIRSPRPDGADACGPPVDPWCAPVRERRDPDRTYYLAIRYAEQQTRPVRSTACGCGCDDDPCEYSRIAEGYVLAVLDELPDCYVTRDVRGRTDGQDETDALLTRREAVGCSSRIAELGTRPCPDCCSPWVVLADLRVAANGTVEVDALAHRRFLASFGAYGFTCSPAEELRRRAVELTTVDRAVLKSAFASDSGELIDSSSAETILAQPASLLRGGSRTKALRDLMGSRTVAQLALSDVEVLKAAAQGAGVDPKAVDELHSLASMASRVIGR